MSKLLEEIDSVNGTAEVRKIDDGPAFADYSVELTGDDWQLTRWYSADEFALDEALQFGAKTLNNTAYRRRCLQINTPWSQIQELYLEAEQTFSEVFEEHGVYSIPPSRTDAEIRRKWAHSKLQGLLEETYRTLRRTIRDLSLAPRRLEDYLTTQHRAVTGIAAVTSQDDTVDIDELRWEEQFLEVRSNSSQEWVAEEPGLPGVTVVDIYLEQYGPVVAVKSRPEHADMIKELNWDETHRRWHPERTVWEVDLDAIEALIDEVVSNNYLIKINRRVVEIAQLDYDRWPDALQPIHERPVMKTNPYEPLPSGTSLLQLPGIGGGRARYLLKGGFGSIPEIAHSTIEQLKDVPELSKQDAETARQGARAALGLAQHPTVELIDATPLNISAAERRIAQAAAYSIPPTETVECLTEMVETPLDEFSSVDTPSLYGLYTASLVSPSAVAELSVAELSNVDYITENRAERIVAEARDVGR